MKTNEKEFSLIKGKNFWELTEKERLEQWLNIDQRFSEKYGKNLTYQQKWEDYNLTPNDAKEWLSNGFKIEDSRSIIGWKDNAFTPSEAQIWLQAGLEKTEYDLALYAKINNYQPEITNKTELKVEYNNWKGTEKDINDCLAIFYPKENRNNYQNIWIQLHKLTGSLTIEGNSWPSLE